MNYFKENLKTQIGDWKQLKQFYFASATSTPKMTFKTKIIDLSREKKTISPELFLKLQIVNKLGPFAKHFKELSIRCPFLSKLGLIYHYQRGQKLP